MLFCGVVVLLVVGAHAMPPTDRVVDVDADVNMEEARRLINEARELEEESPIPGLTGTVLSGISTVADNYENGAATTAFGHHFHLARGEYCHFVRKWLASRQRIDDEAGIRVLGPALAALAVLALFVSPVKGENCASQGYPNCDVSYCRWLNDGLCDDGSYNTAVCGYDDGDCVYGATDDDDSHAWVVWVIILGVLGGSIGGGIACCACAGVCCFAKPVAPQTQMAPMAAASVAVAAPAPIPVAATAVAVQPHGLSG